MKLKPQAADRDRIILTHAESTALRAALARAIDDHRFYSDIEPLGENEALGRPLRELHDLLKGAGR